MSETIHSVEPEWLSEEEVFAIHERQIAEHGGGEGVRDIGLLQSALARPQNAFYYHQEIALSKLAAAYGFGIAKNHAFIDGNKRTALVVTLTFLYINGYVVASTQQENYIAFLSLAEGNLSEEQLAQWLESKLKKRA